MQGYFSQPQRLSFGWASLAFLLTLAVLFGGGIGAFVGRSIGTGSSPALLERVQGNTKLIASDHDSGNTKWVMQERMYLSVVKVQEYDRALDSMELSPKERREMQAEIEARKTRLLWLTLWDWDTQTELGDRISITAGSYQRIFTLSSHRTTIAIPEPRSGTVEFRGEQSEDGIIAISFLTGNRPIALPYMRPGDIAKIEIDTQ